MSHPGWVEALEQARHDVYHLPAYAQLSAGPREEPCAFTYREGGHVLLVPLVLRPVGETGVVDAVSPYGYPGPVSSAPLDDGGFWRRAVQSLVEVLAERGVVTCFVRLHPLLPPRLDALALVGSVVHHGRTVVIDCRTGEEEFRRGLRKRTRSQLRRAEEAGLTVVVDDWSGLEDFVEIYHETMRRVGARPGYLWDLDHFRALREALGGRLHLVAVIHEGRRVASTLVLEHDGLLGYHLGGTRTDALHLDAARFELAAIRRWGAGRGARTLHLGGGLGGVEDELYRFKAGFSKDRAAFFSWRVVVDAAEQQRLTAQLAPGEDLAPRAAPFFPPYRAGS